MYNLRVDYRHTIKDQKQLVAQQPGQLACDSVIVPHDTG